MLKTQQCSYMVLKQWTDDIMEEYINCFNSAIHNASCSDDALMHVDVGPAEAAAAAAPASTIEGMLSRKHEWESTTKKSNAR